MNFFEVRNAWSRVIKKRKQRRRLIEINCPVFGDHVHVENNEGGELRCVDKKCMEINGKDVIRPLVVRGEGISVYGAYPAFKCESKYHRNKRKPIKVNKFEENGQVLVEETYETRGGFEIFARKCEENN